MCQGDAVELFLDEGPQVVGGQALHQDGVGDAALDVVVDAQGELVEQLGLSEEDEVVVLGEVLEEQAQPAQSVHVHQVCVVDDGGEHLAEVIDAMYPFGESRS